MDLLNKAGHFLCGEPEKYWGSTPWWLIQRSGFSGCSSWLCKPSPCSPRGTLPPAHSTLLFPRELHIPAEPNTVGNLPAQQLEWWESPQWALGSHVFNSVPQRAMAEVTAVLYPISICNSHLGNSSCTVDVLLKSFSRKNCGMSELFWTADRVSWLLQLSDGNKCKCCTLCQSNSRGWFPTLPSSPVCCRGLRMFRG